MIKNFILSSLAFIFAFTTLSGQAYTSPCGTIGEYRDQVVQRLDENIMTLRSFPIQQRDDVYVPLTIHVIARDNGTGGVSEKKVFDQLCEMNTSYESTGMVFYIKQFKYMSNSTIYENHSGASFLMNSRRDQTSINIWCVKDASPSSGGLGTTLGYFSPFEDWIVMRNDEFGISKKTLPHEVGHFFSLPHPHNGWDHEPYKLADHGNPVQSISPEGIPTELQDGSNCATAGDKICDTTPDYNFGFGWGDCNYNAGTMDPSGTVVDPIETNMMAYFLHCAASSYDFTPTQEDLMITDYNTNHRAYLRVDQAPSHTEITAGPSLIYPVSGEITANYNTINFEWESIPGANFYYFEVANNVAFNPSLFLETFIVYGNSKVISNILDANKTYYWRVKGMNQIETCEGQSASGTFKTGTTVAAHEIVAINELNIYPNPATNVNQITVQINANTSFESNILLFDIAGKQVGEAMQHDFTVGRTEFDLPITDLESGVYNLTIISSDKAISKKVIIMK